ncbi:predicted protein [Uncinocarpus reesii 1704]|uniref:Uncharacterized protein n=1 Tax=Uncinocarpus reesii (strain UAMH 1704) TaxID=336963 RepID=C4JFI3_UNCRE|nr:uncharacterized protein UREG_00997 [Uncinocarpus reesii 1704]EEP76148.1 predicted protein [Uncinocarpus reesii 1704]
MSSAMYCRFADPNLCLGEVFRSSDVVLTPCDRYTTFCCGQNEAARNCCNTENGTVNVIAGAAIFPPAESTTDPTSTATSSPTILPQDCQSSNCQPPKIAAIVLGAAFGCVSVLAGYLWYRRRQVFE